MRRLARTRITMAFWILFLAIIASVSNAQRLNDLDDGSSEKDNEPKHESVTNVRVKCNSEDITITVTTVGDKFNGIDRFNGMIYPKGLSKNSTCMTPYIQANSTVDYVLPLRSCNTMNTDVANGVEYFNTIVIQPHRKLVTNQGRGYHIRCRYHTEEKRLLGNFDVSGLGITPLTATAAMPGTSMKIYFGEPVEGAVAESVKIGDPLTLVVSIDHQDIYGMHVTDCYVRDGLGWSEQQLINEEGCPLDDEIMAAFEYSSSKTTALVNFQAHKFPYTPSVYYQCNVRLCIRHAGGCDDTPPICENGKNLLKRRRKRQTRVIDETQGDLYDTDREDLKVKVYSGLYVNEASDLDDAFLDNDVQNEISSKAYDPSTICIPQRDFAIGIAIAGLLLIVAVIAAILILLTKRRRRKDLSTTGSSIYSGPYTNTAYSYSS